MRKHYSRENGCGNLFNSALCLFRIDELRRCKAKGGRPARSLVDIVISIQEARAAQPSSS